MRKVCLLFFSLALPCLTLSAAAGQSPKPAPQLRVLSRIPQKIVVGKEAQSVITPCALGVTGVPGYAMSYLSFPNDAYYILLDPEACDCSNQSEMAPMAAHVMLSYPAPGSVSLSVAVVSADLTDPERPMPKPSVFICPPLEYTLAPGESGEFEFVLPLNSRFCFDQKVFLAVTFLEQSAGREPPLLIVTTSGTPRACWNYPAGGTPIDLCGRLIGDLSMSVEAMCCGSLSVTQDTWGGMKTGATQGSR